MRQAGRCLPAEYRQPASAPGISRYKEPAVRLQVTLQPLDHYPLNYAILFQYKPFSRCVGTGYQYFRDRRRPAFQEPSLLADAKALPIRMHSKTYRLYDRRRQHHPPQNSTLVVCRSQTPAAVDPGVSRSKGGNPGTPVKGHALSAANHAPAARWLNDQVTSYLRRPRFTARCPSNCRSCTTVRAAAFLTTYQEFSLCMPRSSTA